MIAPIPKDIPDLPAIPGIAPPVLSVVPAAAVVDPVHRPLTAAFRALVALAAVAGVAIDLLLGSPLHVLSYFTIQSNLLVAVVFAASARRAWTARRPLSAALMGGTLLYISITGLVYHLILANQPNGFSMTGDIATFTGWQAVSNQILHTATPIAAVIDWVLLTRPAPFAVRYATTWLLYPLAYLALSLARGAMLPPAPRSATSTPSWTSTDTATSASSATPRFSASPSTPSPSSSSPSTTSAPTRSAAAADAPKTGFRLRPPVG